MEKWMAVGMALLSLVLLMQLVTIEDLRKRLTKHEQWTLKMFENNLEGAKYVHAWLRELAEKRNDHEKRITALRKWQMGEYKFRWKLSDRLERHGIDLDSPINDGPSGAMPPPELEHHPDCTCGSCPTPEPREGDQC